jgi:hypothetical protein
MPPACDAVVERAPPGRTRRLARYLAARFPPAVQVPTGLLLFGSVHLGLQGLAGGAPLRVGPRALVGAATVIGFALLLRVQDDLKDAAHDRALAAAGDPRFTGRPLVTGAVAASDLRALRAGVLASLAALNAPLGAWPCAAFAVALGATVLSGRWFFVPRIARSLLLAFATHNPLAALVLGYVVAVFAADFGPGAVHLDALPLVLAPWAAIAAWEVARKLRPPGAETGYETYSARLGFRRAALLPALGSALSAGGFAHAARGAGLGPAYPAAVLASAALVAAACLRFRLAPSARTARLRPVVEVFAAVATGGFVVALAAARGLSWR